MRYSDIDREAKTRTTPRPFLSYHKDREVLKRLYYPNYTLTRGDKEYIIDCLYTLARLEREASK